MKKLLTISVCLLLLICLLSPIASALDYGFDVPLASPSACLYNLDTDTLVYSVNETASYPPASLTKLMTALVAMDMSGGQDIPIKVTASLWNYFTDTNPSLSGIKPNEETTLFNLLHCMLIQSGCEAAVAIAVHFGYNAFIEAMNAKASALGCVNSLFVNPHGLPAEGHHSCANDMMLIAREVCRNEYLSGICSLSRYYLSATNKNDARYIVTTNLMLNKNSDYYTSWITGLKTGYVEGNRAMAATVERGGMRFLLVLMGAPAASDGKWIDGYSTFNDAYASFEWCRNYLSLKIEPTAGTAITSIEVLSAKDTDSILLYPKEPVTTLRRDDTTYSVTYEVSIPEAVKAPIVKGQVVGTVKVFVDGEYFESVELISLQDVEFSRFQSIIEAIAGAIRSKVGMIIIIILALLLLFYIIFIRVIVPNSRSNRHKKG